MARDQTHTFRTLVRARADASSILKPIKKKKATSAEWQDFLNGSDTALSKLLQLHLYMQEYATSYLNFRKFPGITDKQLSESQRDDYESVVEEALEEVEQQLSKLEKVTLASDVNHSQYSVSAHRSAIVHGLRDRFQHVQGILKEQQKLRMRHMMAQAEKLGKLQTTHTELLPNRTDSKGGKGAKQSGVYHGEVAHDQVEDELDEETIRMFEMENKNLAEQLESEMQAAQSLERNVNQLVDMMNFFNEQVVEQKETVNVLSADTDTSTELISDSVTQLEEAKREGSWFAKYFVYLIVGLSITLLFFDWIG